jgi:hypothetical protein
MELRSHLNRLVHDHGPNFLSGARPMPSSSSSQANELGSVPERRTGNSSTPRESARISHNDMKQYTMVIIFFIEYLFEFLGREIV